MLLVKTKRLNAQVDYTATAHDLNELKEKNAKKREKLNIILQLFFANVI